MRTRERPHATRAAPPPQARRPAEGFSDDPTGGRRLTRRLAIALPIAAAIGLAGGILWAVAAGEWRIAPLVAFGVAMLTGAVLAAVEDGRVQRRVSREAARRRHPG
ncbi:MAG: hypothetical protein AB1416_10990 [Actinomycetota bacterium]